MLPLFNPYAASIHACFAQAWIWHEATQTIVTLPQGGNIGRFMYRFLGMDTFMLGHRYFYATAATPGITTILNTDNLGTWRLQKEDAFMSLWKPGERERGSRSLSKLQRLLNANRLLLINPIPNRTAIALVTPTHHSALLTPTPTALQSHW